MTARRYDVRAVLAGAYRGRQDERACVTHALEVDAERSLCGRIEADRLVDSHGGEPAGAVPSCATCAARLARAVAP